MSGGPSTATSVSARPDQGQASAAHDIGLRRRRKPEQSRALGTSARAVLARFDRVIADDKSQALLVWPQSIEGVAVFHALSVLSRLSSCNDRGLGTLFFPWNRNSGGSQRTLLLDRDQLVRSALVPLNQIHARGSADPAYGYLMALHSLKHLSTGGDGVRRQKALERDPGLMHPTLFEVMPQAGIQISDPLSREHQFLQRLRRHTWINERSEHIQAACDSTRTPFFLFGVHPDAISLELFREGGLDPDNDGRRPEIILIDLSRRPRNALGGNRREPVSRLLATVEELYGAKSPPVLAIADDIFVLQTLRWKVLNEYDGRRAGTQERRPAASALILNVKPDVLDSERRDPSWLKNLSVEVYAADLLSFVDSGLKLRRALRDEGDHEIASSVSGAIMALQNLIALPGPRQELLNFLAENYHGHELQSIGSRYDHLTPRGKISAALKLGAAGNNHAELAAFLETYDKLCSEAEAHNPGARIFEDCLSRFAEQPTKSVIAFSSDLLRAFAEWRIENANSLAGIRPKLRKEIILSDIKDAGEILDRDELGPDGCEHILFVEPYADQFLAFLSRPRLPDNIVVLCHLARAKQVLQ